ncbi:MAG: type II secretion system minor pseudopilin GspJ [Methylomonas sp.]|jgi:general secretion pathway protein J|uniref:type II secretion system minor pseudopilin GspJ n=1 Tax=Methylomonas sp. TaxID=418 RepID=UPI0025CCA0F2|nr:type II secretion system minor pseudopilin GspJ [Methylomonas sp.]MCK9606098.1 type II secretion system minor pseudopilin GspJ [Methylomonas sp.]
MSARLGGVKGFTLLELLIAMAIFAIMATMAYGGLKSVIDTRQATQARAMRVRQLQQTLYLLNEDLLQALPRTIRDELGDDEPAFRGSNGPELLSLTRAAPALLQDSERSRLQRVSYRFESGQLYRLVWSTLDRTQQSQPLRKHLLDADGVQIQFFGSEWVGSWPASGSGLPKAVEVVFSLSGLGDIRRGFWIR